jgi:inner membrane protein
MTQLMALPATLWWLIAGAILLTLEVVVPGVFLLWFGAAALAIGGLLMYVPLDLPQQMIAFAALAILAILFARLFLRYGVTVTDQLNLNQRGHRYVGQTVTVTEAIVNGRGKVRVGDTMWNAVGPDCVTGARVRIAAIDGTVLKVDAI